MSLPKRIYDLYRELLASELVQSNNVTDENMQAFANLLNQCTPIDAEEASHRNIVRGMYYSNPVGFLKYISQPRNRVGALVLYTESKCVAKLFNLKGRVHVKWDETTSTYSVTRYVPREQRPDYVPPSQDAVDQAGQPDQTTQQTAPKGRKTKRAPRPNATRA